MTAMSIARFFIFNAAAFITTSRLSHLKSVHYLEPYLDIMKRACQITEYDCFLFNYKLIGDIDSWTEAVKLDT